MLAPDSRLLPLIHRYLYIKVLNRTAPPMSFKPDENPLLQESLVHDDPCTIPLTLRINGRTAHDGFYSIPIYLDKNLQIPANCDLKVLHWTLDIERQNIVMTIIKGTVVNTLIKNLVGDLCPIEDNPVIHQLLKTFRIKNLIEQVEAGQEDSSLSISSPEQLIEQSFPATFMSEGPEEGYMQEPIPAIKQEVIATPQVSLGMSNKSRQVTEEFKRQRSIEKVVASQEDLVAALVRPPTPEASEAVSTTALRTQEKEKQDLFSRLQQINETELFRAMKKAQEPEFRISTVPIQGEELSIEVFPDWSLEYMKFYYKI